MKTKTIPRQRPVVYKLPRHYPGPKTLAEWKHLLDVMGRWLKEAQSPKRPRRKGRRPR